MVVLSTAPNEDVARQLAELLVGECLAACVNIVGGVRSLYWWEGHVQDDAEVLLLMKTERRCLEALTSTLREHHPYECPEVVALPIEGGSRDYLQWIHDSLARDLA